MANVQNGKTTFTDGNNIKSKAITKCDEGFGMTKGTPKRICTLDDSGLKADWDGSTAKCKGNQILISLIGVFKHKPIEKMFSSPEA